MNVAHFVKRENALWRLYVGAIYGKGEFAGVLRWKCR